MSWRRFAEGCVLAADNPATNSDPTGLNYCADGECYQETPTGPDQPARPPGTPTTPGNPSGPPPVPTIVHNQPHARQIVVDYNTQLTALDQGYNGNIPDYLYWLALAQACWQHPGLCSQALAYGASTSAAQGEQAYQAQTTAFEQRTYVGGTILGHVYLQASVCPFVTCFSATFQGGHAWASFQPVSLTKIFTRDPEDFAGVSLGVNGATSEQAIHNNIQAGGGAADGPGFGVGESWYTPLDSQDYQVSSNDFHSWAQVTYGEGFFIQGSPVVSFPLF